jgi:hypothetical protein
MAGSTVKASDSTVKGTGFSPYVQSRKINGGLSPRGTFFGNNPISSDVLREHKPHQPMSKIQLHFV